VRHPRRLGDTGLRRLRGATVTRHLFAYQEEAARRMAEKGQMACFLEPGLGKTSITLDALARLGNPRTLVLAPARVAETVWHAEAQKWAFPLDVRPAVGSPEYRTSVVKSDADVVVMSYENLPWLLTTHPVQKWFRAIVFDELSKMKSPGTSRFRRLRAVLPSFDIRFGLTGTPVGNHLMDIWGEMYCIAGEKPLGPTFTGFQYQNFWPVAFNKHVVTKWRAKDGAEQRIHAAIKPWAFTLSTTAAPPLPEFRVNVLPVALPAAVEEMSRALAEDLTVKLASGEDLYAFSAATAAMKVRQMAGGAVYVEPPTVLGEPPAVKKWEVVHGEKLRAMEDLVSELQGSPLLVFYWFRHERERLLAHFENIATDINEPDAITRWNRGEVEMLLAHPASAGHGLNLQQGGHNICWYTLPWSLEMWKQANGRLVRHGQRNPWVVAHVLEAGKSDRLVLSVLHAKAGVEDRLLAAMLD
jgi:hypothetical protein